MSLVLIGTHALAQTTLILPNPGWNNERNKNLTVNWKQTMNGKLYSYITGTDEEVLQYDFLISEDKAEELDRFFKIYSTTINRMYTPEGTPWTVRFVRPDLVFTVQGPSEFKQVTLDLIGRRL